MKYEFLQLDPYRIKETADRLTRRITERLPDRNLRRVAADLSSSIDVAVQRTEKMRRRNLPLRIAIAAILVVIPTIIVKLALLLDLNPKINSVADLIQTSEAALATIVFLGAAAFFVATIEARIKRNIAITSLDELRAFAHIVDMHQLTKDPDRVRQLTKDPEQVRPLTKDTTSSPKPGLSAFEIARYYDYCSELLSLVAKVGALYSQASTNPDVGVAVDDLETLANGITRKIWQKSQLLHMMHRDDIESEVRALHETRAAQQPAKPEPDADSTA